MARFLNATRRVGRRPRGPHEAADQPDLRGRPARGDPRDRRRAPRGGPLQRPRPRPRQLRVQRRRLRGLQRARRTRRRPATPPSPRDTPEPADSAGSPSATDALPTPGPGAIRHARADAAAVGRQGAAQRPAGRRGRTRYGDATFNTDTLIVVSIDPVTKQVAMFQVPRDTVDVPVPANARPCGARTYGGKINSWFDPEPQPGRPVARQDRPTPAASTPSRRSSASSTASTSGTTSRSTSGASGRVVDTLGGVQINVQMPVYESQYPAGGGLDARVHPGRARST